MSLAASLLTRVGRASLRRGVRLEKRCICSTRSVQKQKGKAFAEDEGEMFGDDLFTDPSHQPPRQKQQPSSSSSTSQATTKRKPSPEERAAKFNHELDFVGTRLRDPKEGQDASHIPATTWFTLLELASSKEDLAKVVELLPLWAKTSRTHKDDFAEHLARRCDELDCADTALEIFGDFSQYRIALTPAAVHSLFHGLRTDAQKLSISAHVARAHGLGDVVSNDIINASILAAASLQSSIPLAKTVAKELLPVVEKAVVENPKETSKVLMALSYGGQKVKWVLQAVEEINAARGGDVSISTGPLQARFKPKATS